MVHTAAKIRKQWEKLVERVLQHKLVRFVRIPGAHGVEDQILVCNVWLGVLSSMKLHVVKEKEVVRAAGTIIKKWEGLVKRCLHHKPVRFVIILGGSNDLMAANRPPPHLLGILFAII